MRLKFHGRLLASRRSRSQICGWTLHWSISLVDPANGLAMSGKRPNETGVRNYEAPIDGSDAVSVASCLARASVTNDSRQRLQSSVYVGSRRKHTRHLGVECNDTSLFLVTRRVFVGTPLTEVVFRKDLARIRGATGAVSFTSLHNV